MDKYKSAVFCGQEIVHLLCPTCLNSPFIITITILFKFRGNSADVDLYIYSHVEENCLEIICGGIQEAIIPSTATYVDEKILQLIHIYLLTLDAILKTDSTLVVTEAGAPLVFMSDKIVEFWSYLDTDHMLYIPEDEIKVG